MLEPMPVAILTRVGHNARVRRIVWSDRAPILAQGQRRSSRENAVHIEVEKISPIRDDNLLPTRLFDIYLRAVSAIVRAVFGQ
jgi:hypothetical protein